MKYFEIKFTLQPCSDDACDVLSALAADAGFETFEPSENGLTGYVQQSLFSQQTLDSVLADFPFEGTHIAYTISEAEDTDWNAAWEQEGFNPIVVDRRLVVHDGRHLPEDADEGTIQIEIDAHMAFGTGTHETTRLMCRALLEQQLDGCRVLDCGCGTGILGICALKLGAIHCTAYDIDEWSTENTRHNAVINQVDQRTTVLHGDATLLDSIDKPFDVVMANINRNILLNDMPRFARVMAPKATLLLSGFYTADTPLLQQEAERQGLTLDSVRQDGEWACMVFTRK